MNIEEKTIKKSRVFIRYPKLCDEGGTAVMINGFFCEAANNYSSFAENNDGDFSLVFSVKTADDRLLSVLATAIRRSGRIIEDFYAFALNFDLSSGTLFSLCDFDKKAQKAQKNFFIENKRIITFELFCERLGESKRQSDFYRENKTDLYICEGRA